MGVWRGGERFSRFRMGTKFWAILTKLKKTLNAKFSEFLSAKLSNLLNVKHRSLFLHVGEEVKRTFALKQPKKA